MIAKYVLILIMNGNSYSMTTQEFYSLAQCQKTASYLEQNSRVNIAYCTEK